LYKRRNQWLLKVGEKLKGKDNLVICKQCNKKFYQIASEKNLIGLRSYPPEVQEIIKNNVKYKNKVK